MLPYYKRFSLKKKLKRRLAQSVINVLVSTNIEAAHHKCMYQSLKHLEPFKFDKAEDIPVAFYFPSLALGWLLLHSESCA